MTYIVTGSEAGKRLDAAAASLSGLSRSASERLISDGRVLLNGVCAGKKTAVREGDLIDIEIPEPYAEQPVFTPLKRHFHTQDWGIAILGKKKNYFKGLDMHRLYIKIDIL